MKRKYKRTVWGFSKLDCNAMIHYLERMADKGWLIVRIDDRFAIFKSVAPENYSFDIDISDDFGIGMSTAEVGVNKGFTEYIELCGESGWHYLCSWGYLHFFSSNEGEEPVPLQTDKDMEEENIFSKLWKGEVSKHLRILILWLAMALLVFNLWFGGGKVNDHVLRKENFLMNAAMVLFYIIPTAFAFIYTLWWYGKARLHIRQYGVPAHSTMRTARFRAGARVAINIAYLILLWSLLLHSSIKDGSLASSVYTRLVVSGLPLIVIISAVVMYRFPLIFDLDSIYTRRERALVIVSISVALILVLFIVEQFIM